MSALPVVTFPDRSDFDDLPEDPFSIVSTTSDGDKIRPAVIIALLNSEMKTKLEKRLKADARSKGLPEPIIAPARLSESETTARMADLLIGEWDKYHTYFPAATLSRFLDDRAGRTMEAAFAAGKPMNRDDVRRAIGQLWHEADAKRKEKH